MRSRSRRLVEFDLCSAQQSWWDINFIERLRPKVTRIRVVRLADGVVNLLFLFLLRDTILLQMPYSIHQYAQSHQILRRRSMRMQSRRQKILQGRVMQYCLRILSWCYFGFRCATRRLSLCEISMLSSRSGIFFLISPSVGCKLSIEIIIQSGSQWIVSICVSVI